MKYIEDSRKKQNWENSLLNDLAFIKRKGRYPISRKTFGPAIILLFFIIFSVRFIFPVLLIKNYNNPILYLVPILCVVMVAISIYQYRSTIVFRRIATDFFLTENQQLLIKFFQSQHLAYSTHPDAPEVFMILSKNINTSSNEQREVMIFITDDKQILINSHFTRNKFSITPPSKHYKQMGNRLNEWINIHINKNNITSVSTNKI